MTPRYFESYFNADPMVEISETTARELGEYVVEVGGPLRQYRRFSNGALDSILYAGWDDPAEPIADLKRGNEGVPGEIYSPVVRCSHGGPAWQTWYVDPTGDVTKILENEYNTGGDVLRRGRRSPDGALLNYTLYHYNDDGYLYELTTHAPDGTVTARREV